LFPGKPWRASVMEKFSCLLNTNYYPIKCKGLVSITINPAPKDHMSQLSPPRTHTRNSRAIWFITITIWGLYLSFIVFIISHSFNTTIFFQSNYNICWSTICLSVLLPIYRSIMLATSGSCRHCSLISI
jgi:magnesium-transporting ATPase (P-type)